MSAITKLTQTAQPLRRGSGFERSYNSQRFRSLFSRLEDPAVARTDSSSCENQREKKKHEERHTAKKHGDYVALPSHHVEFHLRCFRSVSPKRLKLPSELLDPLLLSRVMDNVCRPP